MTEQTHFFNGNREGRQARTYRDVRDPGAAPRGRPGEPATVPRVSRVIPPGPEGTAIRAVRSERSKAARRTRGSGGGGFHLPGGSNKGGSGSALLKAEFFAVLVIVGLRMVADYVPDEDESKPGSETPAKGLSPFPLLLVFTFLWALLGLVADIGPRASRISGLFGSLLVIGLLFNSSDELSKVADWADNFKSDKFAEVAGGGQAGSLAEDITPAAPSSTGTSNKKTKTGSKTPKTGDYYFNPLTGVIQQQTNSFLAAALKAIGYHGVYDTLAEAKAALKAYEASHSKPKL